METKIPLTEAQWKYARRVGQARERSNRKLGRRNTGSTVTHDEFGAGGEYAMHLLTGLPWNYRLVKANKYRRMKNIPDLGKHVEVRTVSIPQYKLPIKVEEPMVWVYIQVAYQSPRTFHFMGWTTGKRGKQRPYWRDDIDRPAFLVPREALRSADELDRYLDLLGEVRSKK